MPELLEISEVLSQIDNPSEIKLFFDEILTDKEKKDIALRWELLKKLKVGMPQRAIASELGISLCKITRGSKILKTEDSIIRRILDNDMG